MLRTVLSCSLAACGATQPSMPSRCAEPIRLTSQLAACEGQVVTLIGRVERRKQATLVGVDVEVDYALMGGPVLEARGLLQRFEVKPMPPEDPDLAIASRGPGTYWLLMDGDKLATAKPRQ